MMANKCHIKKDDKVKRTRFSSNFLNNIADIFEKYGFGTTKTVLYEKKNRRELKYQAAALLSVIGKFEDYDEVKRNRSIGRYIIKTLITIKFTEVKK